MSVMQEEVKTLEKNSWEEALEKEAWICPLIDIYENEDNYFIGANMPGVSKENIKVKLEDGSLEIMGKINFEEALNRSYVLRENKIGNYYRKFKISNNIDTDKIDAAIEKGQLTVKLPKHERIKPRSIDIR